MSEDRLIRVIEDCNQRNLNLFFRSRCENYAEVAEELEQYNDERFRDFQKLGEIRFDNGHDPIGCLFISCHGSIMKPLHHLIQ